MDRAILHIDLDAFYASVEQRDDPKLRGKPVIVGGHPTRGVVLAASYEVRPFGVRSAMPMSRAVRLAPHAIVVPPRPRAYVEASEHVFSLFESVTPLVEPLSLDEAFLDVTGSRALFGAPDDIARTLRRRIFEGVRLHASAGIAPNKFVAKIASDLAKPNGQRGVTAPDVVSFLAPLPVSRLWGVGPKLEATLVQLGLQTVGDIAAQRPDWLESKLGATGPWLRELALGHDDRPVVPDREAKSVGSEDTFEEDLADAQALEPHIHSQAWRVARRLRRAGVKTRVVQLKLKYADFALTTRRQTLEAATDDGQTLYRAALALLHREPLRQPVRLTGVSAQELGGGTAQLPLFQEGPSRTERLNEALDRLERRFGPGVVRTADLSDAGDRDDEVRRRMGAGSFPKKRPEG